MARNTALVLLALALIAASAWIALGVIERGTPDATSAVEPAGVVTAEEAELSEPLDLADVAQNASSTRAPVVEERQAAAVDLTPVLSGVTGRLVEPGGTPSAGTEVVLLELRLDELRAALADPMEAAPWLEVVIARDTTDRDGRFHLDGAWSQGLHALAGTRKSPRVPLRIVAEALEPGARLDLGDVVLAGRASLTGRVIDGEGAPVARARVRAGAIPDHVLALGLADLRPDGALFLGEEEMHIVVPVPPWIARLEEHLPLATAFTDDEGRFALADVSAGEVTVVVDHRGHASAIVRELLLEPGESRECDVGLDEGLVIRGRVLTAEGAPVARAEVLAGAVSDEYEEQFAVLVRGAPTDERGCFAIRGITPGEGIAVVARAEAFSSWAAVKRDDVEGDVELELRLPATGTLAIEVVQRGERLPGARVRLSCEPLLVQGSVAGLVPAPDPGQRLREESPGSFVIDGLSYGSYACFASAPEKGTGFVAVELDSARSEVTIALDSNVLAVRVVDAADLQPVGGASLLLEGQGERVLASGTTDRSGTARLQLVGKHLDVFLRVEHPAYAPAYIAPDASGLEVRLGRGGALHARVVPAPAGGSGLLLLLECAEAVGGYRPDMTFQPLRLDERGQATLARLAPGKWRYELIEGWGRDANMLALLVDEEPDDPEQGGFEIRAGQTTELEIRHESQKAPVEAVR